MSEPTTTAPVVDVVVTTDGTAQITVNGVSHELTASDVDNARRRSVAHIASTVATPAGGPVLAKVVDPDGSWHLLIHPDGTLGEAPTTSAPVSVDEPATASASGLAPTTTSTRSTPAPAPAAPARARPAADDLSTEDVEETSARVVPVAAAPRPNAQDLLGSRSSRTLPQRAREGWRGWMARSVGLPLAPGAAEAARFELTTTVQAQLPGPRTVMVVNPKGGVGKTTTTLLLSAALGQARGGGVLAWDNNETRGTMGLRSADAGHGGTVRTLLAAALELISTAGRLGDLDAHVHHQAGVRFDVLRSDEDPTGAGVVDADDFAALHTLIQRFYRLVVIDTGNNIRSANWQAAAAQTDQLVITTTVREDSAASAAWMVDALAAGPYAHLLERAVTVLSDPSPRTPEDERKRLTDHFAAATGGDPARVVRVPFDRALSGGGVINHDALSSSTRTAWLCAAAAVVDQLAKPGHAQP
ncbi:hypothetical protein WDV85_16765 [Pseudokineococcus sp. 5B2Z-1]|uniref:nucleotide-binding protein n=1 Tax=Pseudokineococcus sp. 5B2Z-1 TaxID=3132744 RepID=UPI0030A326BB